MTGTIDAAGAAAAGAATAGAPGAAASPGADQRLTELEIKLSFCEDLVETLNATVYRQQLQIDRLIAELRTVREQLVATAPAGEPRSLRDELPPHY